MASTNRKWNRREKIHHASKTPLLPQNFSGSGSWESNSIKNIFAFIYDKPHVISSDISTSSYVKPPLPCSTWNLIQVFLLDFSFWMKAAAVFDHKSSKKKLTSPSRLAWTPPPPPRHGTTCNRDLKRSNEVLALSSPVGFGGNIWWGVFVGIYTRASCPFRNRWNQFNGKQMKIGANFGISISRGLFSGSKCSCHRW